ncbi:hypothetical protein [Algibacter sp. Ld11]|uniref:hypothetical protein n=1 Tax=Algibacter sp. Ld11 TaxID=649150 RepID=UPI00386ABEB5
MFGKYLNKRKFPKEENLGEIYIAENKIICRSNNAFKNCEINIDAMQYAYMVVNAQGESSLFICDHHQNWLPTNFKGFSKVYNTLSSKFNFNDVVFFKNINKTTQQKHLVWRKLNNTTFKILDKNYNDYALGFEIQSPQKTFINWDTTYRYLEQHPHVYFNESPYGQKILNFKYPVRLGNIILTDFKAYFDNARTDAPVLHFYTHAFDVSNSDKSYYALKERFQKDFLEENQYFGYERDDQNSFSFKAKGIVISIVYTYDSTYLFDGAYTSLSVKNERDYPELLANSDYENIMEVSEYLVIDTSVKTSSDYKRNRQIKRRPANLLPNNNDAVTIWVDHKNSKIGFADKCYSQVYNTCDISSFTIQNVLPAKGGGASYLELNFKNDNRSYVIFYGSCQNFDAYKEKISKLTGLEIITAPEYYDC